MTESNIINKHLIENMITHCNKNDKSVDNMYNRGDNIYYFALLVPIFEVDIVHNYDSTVDNKDMSINNFNIVPNTHGYITHCDKSDHYVDIPITAANKEKEEKRAVFVSITTKTGRMSTFILLIFIFNLVKKVIITITLALYRVSSK